jgi:hypothetical protein
MFLTNDADNLVKRSDLETVAYGWEYRKLEEIKQVAWPEAADLILKCMQTNEERRLPSFKDALSHPFLAVDESDQRPLFFPQPPHFRATEFHTAIQDGNTEAVRMQLDAGGVHLKMIDDSMSRSKAVELFEQADTDSSKSLSHDEAAQVATSLGLQLEPPQMQLALRVIDVDGNGRIDFEEFFEWYCDSLGESAVLPLARAAFRGCKDVMQILLNEIDDSWPARVRAEILDIRTRMDYTAFMIACECGHIEIAEMLQAKGCSTGLHNKSGKSGSDLLRAARSGREQSQLVPYSHRHNLHLRCDSLESYLALCEQMLDDDIAAGTHLWNAKQTVSHFGREQMKQLEAFVKDLLAKGYGIALHFTDLNSCSLITHSKGIRASPEGQLGGGVSVCLRSLVDFDWGQDWNRFTETIGQALWGSKWYEVMSGEPWPDLEEQIKAGKVKGTWPAARDEWGKWSGKLETVLLVAVPAEANRNPARILPGRSDVYIIPRSDCVPGAGGVFYSNKNIKACLVLKQPANAADLDPTIMASVKCTSEYTSKGMNNFQLTSIDADERVVDIDEGEKFSPKITQFTASVAQAAAADSTKRLHHSALQPTFSSQQLWVENVSRFNAQEMAAGLLGVEQQMTQAYTLAFYFCSNAEAERVCKEGIVASSTSLDGGRHTVTVCLQSLSALGWQENAGGSFRQNVSALMGIALDDVQAMVILGIPTAVINRGGQSADEMSKFCLSEPADELEYLSAPAATAEGPGLVVYSNAHVAKVYELEPAVLVDGRRELSALQAGQAQPDGKDEAQLLAEIKDLLTSASHSGGSGGNAARLEEAVPPDTADLQQAVHTTKVRLAALEAQLAAAASK